MRLNRNAEVHTHIGEIVFQKQDVMKINKKQVTIGASELTIRLIDWSPLNKIVSDAVGAEVVCKAGNGYLRVSADFGDGQVKTKSVVVDKECVCLLSESENYVFDSLFKKMAKNNEVSGVISVSTIELNLHAVHRDENRTIGWSFFPKYHFKIETSEIENCLTDQFVTLDKFMDDRYNYNTRIRDNEFRLLRLVHQLSKNEEWIEIVSEKSKRDGNEIAEVEFEN